MGLQDWTPPAQINGDARKVTDLVGHVLLVRVSELKLNHTTRRFPNPQDKVVVDVIDASTITLGPDGQPTPPSIYVECLWGAGAVVDGLREYAGDGNFYPVKVGTATSGTGNQYVTLEAPEGQDKALAVAAYERFASMVDQRRAQKLAEAQAARANNVQAPVAPVAPPALAPVQPVVPQQAAPIQIPNPLQLPQQPAPAQWAQAPQAQAPAPAPAPGPAPVDPNPFSGTPAPVQAGPSSADQAAALAALNQG